MAELSELKVKVSADIKELTQQLDKGGISLQQFGKQLTATSTKLSKDVTGGANQAGNALMNLGRIAQDAPFGFIGISNNINPLLESFQRLRVETGSAKGALSALAGSLAGGAGIGLAVSVATGLLTVFADKLFKTTKTVDEGKKKLEEYAAAARSNAEGVQLQIAQFNNLITVAKGDVGTKEQQVLALKKLNDLIPDSIGQLTKYNIAHESGRLIILEYVKALNAKATAELLSDRVAKLAVDNIDARTTSLKGYTDNLKEQTLVQKELDKARENQRRNPSEQTINETIRLNDKLQRVQQAGAGVLGEYNNTLTANNKQMAIYNKEIAKATAGSLALDKSLVDKPIKAKKIKLKPEVVDIDFKNVQLNTVQDFGRLIQTGMAKVPEGWLTMPAPTIDPSLLIPAAKSYEQIAIDEFEKAAANIKMAVLNGGFSQIGDIIGTAILGGDVGGAFQGLFTIVADGMKQLGESMIALGTAKVALEKFNLAPGVGTIAAGIGVVALSSILRQSIPKFDKGVTDFKGGLAYVHQGEVLTNLPKGTSVIPKNVVNNIAGGGGAVPYILRSEFRGSDLRFVLHRADAQANRNG